MRIIFVASDFSGLGKGAFSAPKLQLRKDVHGIYRSRHLTAFYLQQPRASSTPYARVLNRSGSTLPELISDRSMKRRRSHR
jgi:hypothetical protein